MTEMTDSELFAQVADEIETWGHWQPTPERGSLGGPGLQDGNWDGPCCLLVNPTMVRLNKESMEQGDVAARRYQRAWKALTRLANENGFTTMMRLSDETNTDQLLSLLRSAE